MILVLVNKVLWMWSTNILSLIFQRKLINELLIAEEEEEEDKEFNHRFSFSLQTNPFRFNMRTFSNSIHHLSIPLKMEKTITMCCQKLWTSSTVFVFKEFIQEILGVIGISKNSATLKYSFNLKSPLKPTPMLMMFQFSERMNRIIYFGQKTPLCSVIFLLFAWKQIHSLKLFFRHPNSFAPAMDSKQNNSQDSGTSNQNTDDSIKQLKKQKKEAKAQAKALKKQKALEKQQKLSSDLGQTTSEVIRMILRILWKNEILVV